MKRGGKGTGAGAATTAVLLLALLLVLAASQADGAAAARRLGVPPNECTYDPPKTGAPCHGHSPSKQSDGAGRDRVSALTPQHP